MTPKDPPAIAVWMLEHLTLGGKNDALAGDLLEEFRRGRPARWYWRQVLAAIILGVAKEIRLQWLAGAFAVLWSVPAPAFWFYVVRRLEESSFFSSRWHLDWPYSTLCDLAFTISIGLLYAWVGLALYFFLFSWIIKRMNVRKLARGLWISLLMYVTVFAGVGVLFAAFPYGRPIDVRTFTAVRLITDMRFPFLALRLPYFLALLISIWMVIPR